MVLPTSATGSNSNNPSNNPSLNQSAISAASSTLPGAAGVGGGIPYHPHHPPPSASSQSIRSPYPPHAIATTTSSVMPASNSRAPPRSRAVAARLSLEAPVALPSSLEDSMQHSPLVQGLLRFSPNNSGTVASSAFSTAPGVSVSPYNRRGRTRFFEPASSTNNNSLPTSNNTSSGPTASSHSNLNFHLSSSLQQPPQEGNNHPRHRHNLDAGLENPSHNPRTPYNPHSELVTTTSSTSQDGIPLEKLRQLATQALVWDATTAPSFQAASAPPQQSSGQHQTQATFFASLLYAKTGLASDALLLAQAYQIAKQPTSALRILEESGILQSDDPWEGLLLACAALSATNEWTCLLEILEDACRLVPAAGTNTTTATFRSLAMALPLDDDDDFGWEALKESISATIAARKKDYSHSTVAAATTNNLIHPLARLCWWRGKAYYETGHGFRAATYWKRALQMDCQMNPAWEALLQRNLITPAEAYQLIATMDFAPDLEWLRTLYLALIELTPQDAAAASTTTAVHPPSTTPFHEDPHHRVIGGVHNAHSSSSSFSLHHNFESTEPMMSPPNFGSPVVGEMSFRMSMPQDDPKNTSNFTFRTVPPHPSAGTTTTIQSTVDAAFDKVCKVYKLNKAPQVLAMAARRAYRRYHWQEALDYCQELSQFDPTLADAAFCYIATLILLGHKRVLFRLAHEWVEASPKSAQAWFAVGAYYYCCERYHVAQRHFCRATRLDPQCTEAWIAFGCSFAACDESDQALASFRAAQRLSPGEHTSLLYMGMEYVRTNHLVLAQYFLQAALSSSGGDPLCLHELGVLAASKNEHREAIAWFQRALLAVFGGNNNNSVNTMEGATGVESCIDMCIDPYWEPTIFNLGHSFRKLRQFEAASRCFERCISLCPQKYSTYSAYAFTKHLAGHLDAAIDFYHQALSCKPDDSFSSEMLGRALQQAVHSSLSLTAKEEEDPNIIVTTETATGPTKVSRPIFSSPFGASSRKDDSAMSEGMESDMDTSEIVV